MLLLYGNLNLQPLWTMPAGVVNKRPIKHAAMYWPPFYEPPKDPRRPRKRRQVDILFLS